MPFMHRNRGEISIIALAFIVCTLLITPARAEYNPKLGRFMQRDPNETASLLSTALVRNAQSRAIIAGWSSCGQYSDGLNLYEYATSNPSLLIDPTGQCASYSLPGVPDGVMDPSRPASAVYSSH